MLAAMKIAMPKKRASLQPFEAGQIWQMEDANLQIGQVGKTLVHYKLFKGDLKRGPVRLSGKDVLEKFLKGRKAVLMQ